MIVFHSDGIATAGIISVNVDDIGVDAYSFSSQQMYGSKGATALYIRTGIRIRPFLSGDVQERERRAGSENVPGIIGFGKACELANGHPQKRLPGNVHISFEYIEGESIVLMLNHEGIAVATGSSCASQVLKGSYVYLVIGLEPATAQGSILFSLGKYNNMDEVSILLKVLPPIIDKLRKMSPIYKGE